MLAPPPPLPPPLTWAMTLLGGLRTEASDPTMPRAEPLALPPLLPPLPIEVMGETEALVAELGVPELPKAPYMLIGGDTLPAEL